MCACVRPLCTPQYAKVEFYAHVLGKIATSGNGVVAQMAGARNAALLHDGHTMTEEDRERIVLEIGVLNQFLAVLLE